MLGEQSHSPLKLYRNGMAVAAEGDECSSGGAIYTAFGGPLQLPSTYLEAMHNTGYCVVEALIVPEVLNPLAEVFARVEAERPEARKARADPERGNFWMMDMMKESAAMTRMCAHPVMLSIMRRYFGTSNVPSRV